MADCSPQFSEFHGKIDLHKSKKEQLRQSRDGVRERIRNHFKNTRKEKVPKFRGQGSSSVKVKTSVNPLDGEYDIDDGVYLQNLPEKKEDWPTAETVHDWIVKAVEGHTNEATIDKAKCVCVQYRGQHHVDLPIYCMHENIPYLAIKGDRQWTISDPKKLAEWFIKLVKDKGEQLRRLVRYIKGWRDFNNGPSELPSGLILTVLFGNHFQGNARDDVAFHETVKIVYYSLGTTFVVPNPVDLSENLAKNVTDSQYKNFKTKLKSLLDDGQKAIESKEVSRASRLWNGQFGDRFPVVEDEEAKSAMSEADLRRALERNDVAVNLESRRVEVASETGRRPVATRPWFGHSKR